MVFWTPRSTSGPAEGFHRVATPRPPTAPSLSGAEERQRRWVGLFARVPGTEKETPPFQPLNDKPLLPLLITGAVMEVGKKRKKEKK